ncbi:MAG: DUF502 domain-containing protein [Acidobacteriota bacterium]
MIFRAEGKRLREVLGRYFGLGLLIIIPTAVTLWILWSLFRWMDNILRPIFRRFGLDIPGLGLITLLAFILALGVVAGNVFGKELILTWERLLKRIPLINKVYTATYQISQAFLGKPDRRIFSKVALVQFPRRGCYAIGFVTATVTGEIQAKTSEKLCSVFVPTTPNPTSGFLIQEPEDRIIILDMSVEDAIKFVISAGSITPSYPPESDTES